MAAIQTKSFQAFSEASVPDECSGAAFDAAVARPALLHELFETQADARPSQVALECGDEQLTYRELEARANRLAHYLQHLGVRRGPCVGLSLEGSADLFVAMLAVLKAGAAYVPLDPDCPAERVRFILDDCGAKLLLTDSYLSKYRRAIARCPATRLAGTATPDDLAYIIYTSDSTGRPKGVQIEHRSVCNFVQIGRASCRER